MIEQSVERLIDHIYEVPLASNGWMSLAGTLEESFNASFAIFVVHPDKVAPIGVSTPLNDEMINLYLSQLWREDRAMSALGSAPLGSVILDSQIVCAQDRMRSRLYSDMLEPNGLGVGMYASVARGHNKSLVVSGRRSARSGDYDLHEINLLKRLVPHLQRSFRTWQRLGEVELERQAAMEAMEHVTVGIALVDKSGRLHFANRIAEEQISNGALNIVNGRVTSRTKEGAHVLQEAVELAARTKRAVAERLALPKADGSASSVLVTPVANSVFEGLHSDNLAMIMIGGQGTRPVEEVAVSRAYGLTPAEARLLAALVEGERIPAYAQRNGISVATAKSHLQALFDKVGERRQADLIRRAISDPVLRTRLNP